MTVGAVDWCDCGLTSAVPIERHDRLCYLHVLARPEKPHDNERTVFLDDVIELCRRCRTHRIGYRGRRFGKNGEVAFIGRPYCGGCGSEKPGEPYRRDRGGRWQSGGGIATEAPTPS